MKTCAASIAPVVELLASGGASSASPRRRGAPPSIACRNIGLEGRALRARQGCLDTHAGRVLLFLLLFIGITVSASAVTLQFEHAEYTVARGDYMEVRVSLNQPVPDGLLAYWLRMEYDDRLFDVATAMVDVVPALNFGFTDPPALRDNGVGHAEIRGFVDLEAPAYTGTAFLNFLLTVREDAPYGVYTFTLVIPQPNSFINGAMQVFDDQIVLGSATIQIAAIQDANDNGVPDDWELEYYDSLDDVPSSVIKQGREYSILEVYIAGVSPLDDSWPAWERSAGSLSIATVAGRSYRIARSESILDPDGWEPWGDEFVGDGSTWTPVLPEDGFYRFAVFVTE